MTHSWLPILRDAHSAIAADIELLAQDQLADLYKASNDLLLLLGRELARRRLAESRKRAQIPGTVENENAEAQADRDEYERKMSIGGRPYRGDR